MARILIFEPRSAPGACGGMLEPDGHELSVCGDREAFLDSLATGRTDLVVYVLDHADIDIALLALVREASPRMPIIVLGAPACLAARRALQDVKPSYFGVLPLDLHELRDAVRGALANPARHRA